MSEPKRSLIKEAQDAIYKMYEDQALKGNLGAKAQVAVGERRRRAKVRSGS